MDALFAQKIHDSLLWTNTPFQYDPTQKKITMVYRPSQEELAYFGQLAVASGLNQPVNYRYDPDYFVLFWGNAPIATATPVAPGSVTVPMNVREEARLGLHLHDLGYAGGTDTGYDRAQQLIDGTVDPETLRTIRNWFARHRFVSYPGYQAWVSAGRPDTYIQGRKNSYRGAIAWLLWGGDSAYNWIRSPEIQGLLNQYAPGKDNTLPSL